LGIRPAVAQDVSTQGKEFWVSFMGNGFKDHPNYGTWLRIQLLISAKEACSCTITNPRTGWQQTFNIHANSTYLYDNIDEHQAYMEMSEYEQVLDKGLIITATDTVSVYCSNIAAYSFDVSYVMPVQGLADDYIIQTYDQSTDNENHTSAFLIVATEDNTTIDITPACTTLGGRPEGETFTITMDRGQCYQVRSHNGWYDSRDLSGSRVTARDCKKIAVFNGNNLTLIPTTSISDSDCVFEQAMPVHSWGKRFIVTSSLGRAQDYVKITSAVNNNSILKNGQPLCTLNATESYIFSLSSNDKSCYLESNGSCAVFLYNTSSNSQGNGAPSMVWIAPLEQRIDEITFSTFNYEHTNVNINVHNVNIIVHKDDVGQVYLDGELLPVLLFETVTGNEDYRFFRKSINHGVHHLACENGFNAHVYGFGESRGYAYMVGSKATNLSTSLTINDLVVQPNEDYKYCVEEPITFQAEVNLQNYTLLWDFGDGTTSSLNPVTHVYHERRVYPATLLVSSIGGGCTGADSDTTHFYIDVTQEYVTEHDEVCAGGFYSGYGFNNVLVHNDTILAGLIDNPIHPECKDSLLVYLTARPAYHIPINDSRCWQGQPGIYDGYGFSFEYDHPGTYDRTLQLQSVNGCDSVLSLHLTVDDQITYEFSHHECGSSYVWDGQSYSTSGDYERYYTSFGGCDSIVTLHLTMGMPQHTSFDTITCSTFHWNGQEYSQTGTYQQQFVTYDGCDSIVECHLILSGNVEGTTTEVSECDSYHWLGTNYTESGVYEKTLSTLLGCDSIVHLKLDLQYTPDPTEIYPKDPENTAPHWVVTATEFQINTYEFTFWDNNSICHWDSVRWEFENPNLHWVLEPDSTTHPVGKKLKIYVLEHVDDTVWLKAKVYNKCSPQGIERRYWFICSFFGIDEDDPSTGSGAVGFEVIPNPNKGQMSLNFKHLSGNIEVKVYDMKGCLMDRFMTYSGSETHSIDYSLKAKGSGIYFFVASGKEGTVTQKVVFYP
jgi:hypothetical protein